MGCFLNLISDGEGQLDNDMLFSYIHYCVYLRCCIYKPGQIAHKRRRCTEIQQIRDSRQRQQRNSENIKCTKENYENFKDFLRFSLEIYITELEDKMLTMTDIRTEWLIQLAMFFGNTHSICYRIFCTTLYFSPRSICTFNLSF